jgi:tetratricopeptide (TPR) repeat protein
MRAWWVATVGVLAVGCSSTGRPPPQTGTAEALARGDYPGAVASADRALARHPGNAWLLYERGSALVALGRLDEGLEALRRAEAAFPHDHERSLAVYRRALALEYAGRCAEASAELSRYADLVRDHEPRLAAEARAHQRLCVPAAPSGRERAERETTARLTRAASDERAQAVRADSTAAVRALTAEEYRAALDRAEAGLAVAPDDPWLLYNKGAALIGLGRLDEALPVLRQAEERFAPTDLHGRSVAIYRRAIALELDNRCEEASAEMRRYAQLVARSQPEEAERALTHVRYCQTAPTRPTF